KVLRLPILIFDRIKTGFFKVERRCAVQVSDTTMFNNYSKDG
ncbi:MAG: hypothetical protein AVDCRST_MAG96-2114, partial [uncultured Segetibacter sp.]